MTTSYDYTKDKRYNQYDKFIYNSLIKLGFRVTNVGAMYLKDLILFAYFNNYYEICITKIVKDFMKANNIDYISYRTFVNCIEYSINSCNIIQFNNNCQIILGISKDNVYLSSKNIIILYLNIIRL